MIHGWNIHSRLCALALVMAALCAVPVQAQEVEFSGTPPQPTATNPPAELPGTASDDDQGMIAGGILKRKGSVMFADRDRDLYYKALGGSTITLTSDDAGVSVDGTFPTALPPKKASVSRPNFHLSSVLYISPESWSVWLNGTRIRNIAPDSYEHVKVINVHERGLDLIWQSDDLQQVAPSWQKNFQAFLPGMLDNTKAHRPERVNNKTDKEKNYTSKLQAFDHGDYNWDYVSPDGRVLIDSLNDIVKVSLRIHETFVSGKLAVMGRDAALNLPAVVVPVSEKSTDSADSATSPGAYPGSMRPSPAGVGTPAGSRKIPPGRPSPTGRRMPTGAAQSVDNSSAEPAVSSQSGDSEFDDLVNEVFEN